MLYAITTLFLCQLAGELLVQWLGLPILAADHPAVNTPGLRVVALESPIPSRTFGLMWKRDAAKSIAIQAFAAVVRAAAQNAMRQASALP